MENMRTEELRKHKASIKSKLMAAIAMLLVSTIMLSSTTYAWFVLSTAPEVTGMTTTVGSNGSLEIALVDDGETYNDALEAITAGVGDSSVVLGVEESNKTWGNIVDLNDAVYGLANVTLYPSALNLTQNEEDMTYTATLADAGMILKTPSYGVDGRIAELAANTYAGKLEDGVFVYDATYYGVRAIGTYANADPTAAALLAAQSGFATSLRNAVNAASNTALNNANASGLTRLLVKHALTQKGSTAITMTLTNADVDSIENTLTALETVVSNLQDAIKYAIVAQDIDANGENATKTFDIVTLSEDDANFGTLIAELNTLSNEIATQKAAAANATTDSYSDQLDGLVDLESMKIGGMTITEIEALADIEDWAVELLEDAVIEVNGVDSVLVKTANMISTFASPKYTVQLDDTKELYTMENATIQVNKTVGTASMETAGTTVRGYSVETTEGGNARPTIQPDQTYGYMIDLAFRASVNTTLQLSAAQKRVDGTDSDLLQGGGSNFTVSTENVDTTAMEELAEALRIVFLDPTTLQIVGVAGITETANEANAKQYDLVMYQYTVDANGGIKLGLPKGQTLAEDGVTVNGTIDYSIVDLTANTAKGLSVLVYLDGNYTDSSMDSVAGMLNLQFSSSVDLTPMEYETWVTEVETTAP